VGIAQGDSPTFVGESIEKGKKSRYSSTPCVRQKKRGQRNKRAEKAVIRGEEDHLNRAAARPPRGGETIVKKTPAKTCEGI